MSDLYLVGAAVGVTLTATAVVSEFVAARRAREQHAREIAELKRRLGELEPKARHDRLHRDHVDTGEAFLFAVLSAKRDVEILNAKLENWAQMAERVMRGGRPDKPSE